MLLKNWSRRRKRLERLLKNLNTKFIIPAIVPLILTALLFGLWSQVWPQETENPSPAAGEDIFTIVQSTGCEEILINEITAVAIGQKSKRVYSFVVGRERIEPIAGNRLNSDMILKFIGTSLALKFTVVRKGCNGSDFDIITNISGWRNNNWFDLTNSFYTRGIIAGTK